MANSEHYFRMFKNYAAGAIKKRLQWANLHTPMTAHW